MLVCLFYTICPENASVFLYFVYFRVRILFLKPESRYFLCKIINSEGYFSMQINSMNFTFCEAKPAGSPETVHLTAIRQVTVYRYPLTDIALTKPLIFDFFYGIIIIVYLGVIFKQSL